MPVLTAANNTNSSLALNSLLGSIPPLSSKSWDLSTDQLESLTALLVNLRKAGVISFKVSSTDTTDDDAIETVRRDEVFKKTPLGKFVAQNGSDETGEGSRARPYATVERALADYPLRVDSVTEGSTYPLFVVWIVAPYEVVEMNILVPARTGGVTPSINLAPMGLDIQLGYIDMLIVAAWSDTVDDVDDPRWEVEETLTVDTSSTNYDRHMYTLTAPFDGANDSHMGKSIRAFSGSNEIFRGVVNSHTNGPDGASPEMAVDVAGTTSAANIGDTILVCRPTVRCNLLTVRGAGTMCLILMGMEAKSSTIYHSTCVDFIGCNLKGSGPPPFNDSTLDIYPYSSVGIKEGLDLSAMLNTELEGAGLPSGESGQWASWPSSSMAPTVDSTCVRMRSMSRFVHRGLSFGVIKAKDGPCEIDMQQGATVYGPIEMDGTGRITMGNTGYCLFGRMAASSYNAAIMMGPLVSASITSDVIVDADTMGDKVVMELRGSSVGGNGTRVLFAPWGSTVNLPLSPVLSLVDGGKAHIDTASTLMGSGGFGQDIAFDTGTTQSWSDIETKGRLIEGLSLVSKFS